MVAPGRQGRRWRRKPVLARTGRRRQRWWRLKPMLAVRRQGRRRGRGVQIAPNSLLLAVLLMLVLEHTADRVQIQGLLVDGGSWATGRLFAATRLSADRALRRLRRHRVAIVSFSFAWAGCGWFTTVVVVVLCVRSGRLRIAKAGLSRGLLLLLLLLLFPCPSSRLGSWSWAFSFRREPIWRRKVVVLWW